MKGCVWNYNTKGRQGHILLVSKDNFVVTTTWWKIMLVNLIYYKGVHY